MRALAVFIIPAVTIVGLVAAGAPLGWQAAAVVAIALLLIVSVRSYQPFVPTVAQVAGFEDVVLVAAAVVLFAPPVLAALAYALFGIGADYFSERGGYPTLLLALGMLGWLAAIAVVAGAMVLRVTRIPAAVAILIVLATGASAIGVIPLGQTVRHHWEATLIALVLICLLGGLASWLAELHHSPKATPAWLPGLAPYASVAGSALLLAGVIAGLFAADTFNVAARGGTEAAGYAVAQPTSDSDLEAAYVPALEFDYRERWLPSAVDAYVGDSQTELLQEQGPARQSLNASNLPTSCPDGQWSPCYQLTINCASGDLPCSDPRCTPGQKGCQPNRPDEQDMGPAYTTVITPTTKQASEWQQLKFAEPLEKVIEYWFFYRYDEWSVPIITGNLVQRHESDWEAVVVGVSASKPLFVGLTVHCGGNWYRWKDVRVLAAPPAGYTTQPGLDWSATHPVVAVARGSHANYPVGAAAHSPPWTECRHVPAQAADALSYGMNVRDRTQKLSPPLLPTALIGETSNRLPFAFPGTWGGHDELLLSGFSDDVPVASAGPPALCTAKPCPVPGGPPSPPLQGLWRDPVAAIFHSDRWHKRTS